MRYSLTDLSGRRLLLVCSTGGHLTELTRLVPQLDVDPSSIWVTFATPQSRSLLRGREVHFVPYVSPRDYRGVVNATRILWPLLKDVEGGLSTGAGVALAALPPLLLRGKPAVYLESIARIEGPSLTGKVLSRLPRVGLYSQHSDWVRPPWRLGPSVLSQYRTASARPRPLRRVFVTLGTIKPYRFDRLIDVVLAFCRQNPELEVLWQVGSTSRTDLPGRVVEQLSDADFAAALRDHDLVIAHAGVGVAMNILDQGHIPLLMAREHAHAEHVDDHQGEILEHLVGLGLAVRAEEALTDESMLDDVRATHVHRAPL